jgi:hypothetical protein
MVAFLFINKQLQRFLLVRERKMRITTFFLPYMTPVFLKELDVMEISGQQLQRFINLYKPSSILNYHHQKHNKKL